MNKIVMNLDLEIKRALQQLANIQEKEAKVLKDLRKEQNDEKDND